MEPHSFFYWYRNPKPETVSGDRNLPKPPEYEEHDPRLTKMKEELIYSTPNDIQTPIQFQNPMAYRDATNAMGQMPGTDSSSSGPARLKTLR